ncbi:unnamed protein product [Rhizophagus irregularis]|nr:unnamed protein product [Rhizophagus irregularis]
MIRKGFDRLRLLVLGLCWVSASVYGRFGFSWIGFGFGIWAFDRYWLLYPWTLDMYRLLCLLPNSRFFNVDGKCFGIEKQKMKYYICRPKIVHCILVLNILYT